MQGRMIATKKVLCLIDGLGSGGAQRQLVGLANLLQEKGYAVLFVWYHDSDFYKPYLQEQRIAYVQLGANNKLQKFYRVCKVVREFRPDTIISYIDGPAMMTCAFKLLGLTVAKIIVSERAVIQKVTRHQRIKYNLYRWADKVVSNAQEQTNLINNTFPFLREKSLTIRNFVDTSYFQPSCHSEPKKDKAIVMLVVGRISRQKNPILLMKAIKKVQYEGIAIKVKWYGGKSHGQECYFDEVQENCKMMNFGDTFCFFSPTIKVLEEYQRCDVFCLPSLFEGFPNVVCEATSCGKPILCSSLNDISFIVHDGENGYLFDPTSVEDMAQKIMKYCMLTAEERYLMGKRSREIALQHLSEASFVQKYIDIIDA